MTVIDLEAEQIYAKVVGQVGGLFRCLKLGLNKPMPELVLYERSGSPG
jgi:hypothetical protein